MGGDTGQGVSVSAGFGWGVVGEVGGCVCIFLFFLLRRVLEVCELLHPGGEWATAA